MTRDEFKMYIESIGFEFNTHNIFYEYKEYSISLYFKDYNFHNGSEWINYNLNDLTPLEKFSRSIKLKALLR